MLYAPAYVAMKNGFFRDAGLDVEMTTAQGGDKSMAALLSGAADIALMGPELAIYVLTSELPTKPRIFSGLTATDGFMLMSRSKIEKFEWSMLKGKDILAASGPARRRFCSSKPPCARTASIRSRT